MSRVFFSARTWLIRRLIWLWLLEGVSTEEKLSSGKGRGQKLRFGGRIWSSEVSM